MKRLLTGFLLGGACALAQSNIYISSSAGTDTTSSGTMGTPYKTIAYAASRGAFVGGNTVNLLRGDTFYTATSDLTIQSIHATSTAPLTVCAYGNSSLAQPTIAHMWNLNPTNTSAWTYTSANIWKIPSPGATGSAYSGPNGAYPVPDLFYDQVRQKSVVLSQLTSAGLWSYDGNYVYVYAAPTDNPGSHKVEANAEGATYYSFADTNWTSLGGSVWKHSMLGEFTYADLYVAGQVYTSVKTQAALTSANEWYNDGTSIYIYWPSTNTPTTPSNVPVQGTAFGYAVGMGDDYYVQFQNIIFNGGRWTTVQILPPTQSISFDGCRILEPGHWGISFVDQDKVPDQPRHENPTVSNGFFNGNWPTVFNSETTSANMNGLTFESCDYATVHNNYMTGWGHTAIALIGTWSSTVEQNYIDPGTANYGRAMELYAGYFANTDAYSAQYNIIRQNFISGQAEVASKLWGQNNYYYANIFQGAKQDPDFDHNQTEGQEASLNSFGETVIGNVYANNVFYNSSQQNLVVNLYIALGYSPGSVEENSFVNNFFGDWATQTADDPSLPLAGFYVTKVTTPAGSKPQTDQVVQFNDFWKTSTSESVILDEFDQSSKGPNNDYSYTAAQANSSLSPDYAGNQQVDPLLYRPTTYLNFDLQPGSPVAASGVNAVGLLGSHATGFCDYDGLPWASTPSIGAYQYAAPWVTSTVTSGATLENGTTQWVGLAFTVNNANDLVVSKLGRYMQGSETGDHAMEIYDPSNHEAVASTVLYRSKAARPTKPVPDDFFYAPLGTPVTLTAGHMYYLLCSEAAGGDSWYNSGATVSTPNFASVNGVVTSPDGATSFTYTPDIGHSYGPLSFKVFDTFTTAWLTTPTPTTTYSNYDHSWRGVKITTGSSPVTIGYLGRWVQTPSTQSHTVEVVDMSGAVVTNATAVVSTSGVTTDGYVWAKLKTPAILQASTSYYIVSEEFLGGDKWYNPTPVTAPTGALVNGDVSSPYGSGTFYPGTTTNVSYGPVNMKY